MSSENTAQVVRVNDSPHLIQPNSIAVRLFKIIFGCYFVVTVIVTCVQLGLTYRDTEQRLIEEIGAMQHTFGPGIANALWGVDPDALLSILTGMRELPNVVGVKVADTDGKIVRAAGTVEDDIGRKFRADAAGNLAPLGSAEGMFTGMIGQTFPVVYTDDERHQKVIGQWTVYSNQQFVVNQVKYGFLLILINSLVKTLALWFIFLFAVQRWLGRPLQQLSTFVGRLNVDNLGDAVFVLRDRGRHELHLLADKLNQMLENLRKSVTTNASLVAQLQQEQAATRALNANLERRVVERTAELQGSNERLTATLRDLQAAEAQLIQSEKMASLGKLVANVAHEINTPISAVKSSGQNIAFTLNQVLANMPKMFRMLEGEPLDLFIRLVSQANLPIGSRSSREERAIKKNLAVQLEESGVADADRKARMLVELGAHSAPLDYLQLLNHPEWDFILTTAVGVAVIVRNTSNINAAVDRVAKIVTTLKSFSQAEGVREMTYANLTVGIESVLMIYQNQIRQAVELVTRFDEVPELRCLADELAQVWTHLIHNALQAMSYRGKLTITLRRSGDEIVISIGDSGTGIPDAIRERIFEPFFTTRPPGEGSGLGLEVVRKVVDKHKGRIEVQTEMGVGSVFTVYLPLTVPG